MLLIISEIFEIIFLIIYCYIKNIIVDYVVCVNGNLKLIFIGTFSSYPKEFWYVCSGVFLFVVIFIMIIHGFLFGRL